MVDCRPDAGRNMAWVSPSCRPHQGGLGEVLAFFFSFFFEYKICRKTLSVLFLLHASQASCLVQRSTAHRRTRFYIDEQGLAFSGYSA